ncbi:MAG TPA: hypothetical protein DIS62_04415 [Candidatus Kerfeldbacteria bacterium]|nr:MAG: hypothetical protein UY34_C0022G0005 [Parcubacteria group bacterium GW2011_GWA2_48_9]HCJ52356.1 hypothetical protein [Candidatus Kerfeldbacteria bacterium]HCM68210.1 hypothetical protein [Candidatus Kerfeldbacteria bacterium]
MSKINVSCRWMKVTLAVVGCLLLAGCGPRLNSGIVVSKKYEPEEKWIQILMVPRIYTVGKSTVTSFMAVPVFHRKPECWVMTIHGSVEDRNGKKKEKTRALYVPRETYEKTSVGDFYTVQPPDKAEVPIEQHDATSEEQLAYREKPACPR